MFHALIVIAVAAVAYSVYKHVGLAKITADVKAAVATAESSVSATVSSSTVVAKIKADLAKYL